MSEYENYDVFLLIQEEAYKEMSQGGKGYRSYIFDKSCLVNLGYRSLADDIVPGSSHFPVLQFFKEFPNYSYYWSVEYDVFFKGDWATFFLYFESIERDFVTSLIHKYPYNPFWTWWNYLEAPNQIPKKRRLSSFNPIYRLSNKAICFVDRELRNGVCGHDEVVLPTILNTAGYTLLDLGMNREKSFCVKNHKSFIVSGRRYSSEYQTGSMRYRPCVIDEEMVVKNVLYHPCK